MRVLPSPVFISAMLPPWSTMPPISCTSKWRMPIVRLPTSRTIAKSRAGGRRATRRARALAQAGEPLAQLLVALELELGLVVADARDPLLVLAKLLRLADVQRAVKKAHRVSVAAGRAVSAALRGVRAGRNRG